MTTHTNKCIYCGQMFTPPKPTTTFCEHCFYSGRHLDASHASIISKLAAVEGVETVEVQHTGGGCFGLAVRLKDARLLFGTVAVKDADGDEWFAEVGLPDIDEQWGVGLYVNDDEFTYGEPRQMFVPLTDEAFVAQVARVVAEPLPPTVIRTPEGKDINERVYDALRAREIKVYFEYPGFIHLPLSDGTGLWTSDQNATWTVDRQSADGAYTLAGVDTKIPREETDVEKIVGALLDVLKNPPTASEKDLERTNCGACGESWNADESDARDPMSYCSRDCEDRDGAYMKGMRG